MALDRSTRTQNLVLATSVTTLFKKGIPKNVIDMPSFWFQSVTCGVIARELAIESRIAHFTTFFYYRTIAQNR